MSPPPLFAPDGATSTSPANVLRTCGGAGPSALQSPNRCDMTDTFLDGRVVVRQSETGFRSGLDAVMLAAAVPARAGDKVLELGAGAGTASLCLMARVPGLALTGVEIDPALVALANQNAAANGATARFVTADIFRLPQDLRQDHDHVFCNPPFHDEDRAPPQADRARALMDEGKLSDWLKTGMQRTVSGGFFTVILRTDRLAEALAALGESGVALLPLWPRAGMPAKRIILLARKGSRAPLELLPGLVLHQENGAWTSEADLVLRRGNALAPR